VGIIYSGESAFSRVLHSYSSAFTARMFSRLLRGLSISVLATCL